MAEGVQNGRPDMERTYRGRNSHFQVPGIAVCKIKIKRPLSSALPWRTEPGPLNGSYREVNFIPA